MRTHGELRFLQGKGHVWKTYHPRDVLALRFQQKGSVALDQHPRELPVAGRDARSEVSQSSSGSGGSSGSFQLAQVEAMLGRSSFPTDIVLVHIDN